MCHLSMLLKKVLLFTIAIAFANNTFSQNQLDTIRRVLIEKPNPSNWIFPPDPNPRPPIYPPIWPPGIDISTFDIASGTYFIIGSLCGDRFHENGNISSRCECNADSTLHGKSVYWDERGRITNVYIYLNGKIYKEKDYDEGRLSSVENFNYSKEGYRQQHGLSTTYFSDGKITTMYKNGQEHGLMTQTENGVKISETEYNNGIAQWKKEWRPNGQLSSEMRFNENAHRIYYRTWSNDGTLTLAEQSEDQRKIGEWMTFDPKLNRRNITTYKDGRPRSKDVYINDKLHTRISFKNGIKTGYGEYGKEGEIIYTINYNVDGTEAHRRFTNDGPNGAGRQEMEYYKTINNQYIGISYFRTDDGTMYFIDAPNILTEYMPIQRWVIKDLDTLRGEYVLNNIDRRQAPEVILQTNSFNKSENGKWLRDGVWKIFNGNYISKVITYKLGKRNGRYINYCKNGKDPYPVEYGEFTNDDKSGLWVSFSDTIIEHQTYEGNLRNGQYIRINRRADTLMSMQTSTFLQPPPPPIKTIIEHLDTSIVSNYVNDVLEGNYKEYDSTGAMVIQGEFSNGLKNGLWIFYDSNGIMKESGQYRNGELKGNWYEWIPNKKGVLKRRKIT